MITEGLNYLYDGNRPRVQLSKQEKPPRQMGTSNRW